MREFMGSVMWRYEQSTGRLWKLIATGYSGLDDGDGVMEPGEGKNDPAAEALRGIGPIPRGHYQIGEPFNGGSKGPFVMRLTPHRETDTHGRSGFLIHGDSIRVPGSASHGCIIFPRKVREEIWNSADHEIEVVK